MVKRRTIFFRYCSKQKFLLCHVVLVNKHTMTPEWSLQNACVVQVFPRVELTRAKETVEVRWSVREITSGILWVSSAGELAAHAQGDTECILT